MKKNLLMVLSILLACSNLYSQLLMVENFDYFTGKLSDYGWNVAQNNGSYPIQVVDGNLTFSGYASSNIGRAIFLEGAAGEQTGANLSLPVTSGSVYAAFLVNFASAPTNAAGDAFIAFSPTGSSTGAATRVHVKADASENLAFGVVAKYAGGGASPVFTPFNYSLNTTYLIVLKHTFNTGSSTDDAASLFVFPASIPASEPSPDLGPVTTSDPDLASIRGITLLQRTSAINVFIDGIRVATSWNLLFTAAPKQPTFLENIGLTYNSVFLHWTDNSSDETGFAIFRGDSPNGPFTQIGTESANSNSYIDDNLNSTTNYYYYVTAYKGSVHSVNSNILAITTLTAIHPFSRSYNNLMIYPNPAIEKVTVDLQGSVSGSVTYEIRNEMGVVKLSGSELIQGTQNEMEINIGSLNAGVYVMQLTIAEEVRTAKLIVR